MLFCALFVCKRVLYWCQRVATQLQLTDISSYDDWGKRYSGTLVLWYSGTLVLGYSGTLVLWYSGTLVLWYSVTLVLWYSGTLVLWYSVTLVLGYSGTLVLWYSVTLVLWYSGTLVLWYSQAKMHGVVFQETVNSNFICLSFLLAPETQYFPIAWLK